MPKSKLKHMLSNGTLATRSTARTYSHVIVADLTVPTWIQGTEHQPGLAVVGWVGRPDLVPAAFAERRKGGMRDRGTYHAEPINGGVRP